MILYVQVERNLIEMYAHNIINTRHMLFTFNLLINLKDCFDIYKFNLCGLVYF